MTKEELTAQMLAAGRRMREGQAQGHMFLRSAMARALEVFEVALALGVPAEEIISQLKDLEVVLEAQIQLNRMGRPAIEEAIEEAKADRAGDRGRFEQTTEGIEETVREMSGRVFRPTFKPTLN